MVQCWALLIEDTGEKWEGMAEKKSCLPGCGILCFLSVWDVQGHSFFNRFLRHAGSQLLLDQLQYTNFNWCLIMDNLPQVKPANLSAVQRDVSKIRISALGATVLALVQLPPCKTLVHKGSCFYLQMLFLRIL